MLKIIITKADFPEEQWGNDFGPRPKKVLYTILGHWHGLEPLVNKLEPEFRGCAHIYETTENRQVRVFPAFVVVNIGMTTSNDGSVLLVASMMCCVSFSTIGWPI